MKMFLQPRTPAFLWSQSDVFNSIGQNPRQLFPWLQPVSEQFPEPLLDPRTRAAWLPWAPRLCAGIDAPRMKLTQWWCWPQEGGGPNRLSSLAPRPPATPQRNGPPNAGFWCLREAQPGVRGQESSGDSAGQSPRDGTGTTQDHRSPQPRKTRTLKTLPRIPAGDPRSSVREVSESSQALPAPRLFPTFVQKVLICTLKALRGPPAKEPNFV